MKACVSSFAVVLALASACSGGGTAPAGGEAAFPAAPYASARTDDGSLRIEVRTAPSQPPGRGTSAVEVSAIGADGAPVDGLSVDVVVWMPAHGHGASVRPTVRAKGGGKYELSNVTLFMPGDWELRLSFTGKVVGRATTTLSVP